MPLTDTAIRNAKPGDKPIRLSDGGMQVIELRRVWPVLDYEPTGPYWDLTFVSKS